MSLLVWKRTVMLDWWVSEIHIGGYYQPQIDKGQLRDMVNFEKLSF